MYTNKHCKLQRIKSKKVLKTRYISYTGYITILIQAVNSKYTVYEYKSKNDNHLSLELGVNC